MPVQGFHDNNQTWTSLEKDHGLGKGHHYSSIQMGNDVLSTVSAEVTKSLEKDGSFSLISRERARRTHTVVEAPGHGWIHGIPITFIHSR